MTITSEIAVGSVLDAQQNDGGWAYSDGSSWTEPTCLCMMALRAAMGVRGGAVREVGRAAEWLLRRQRRDGGWSPGPGVERSTHVTSLAILALSGANGYQNAVDHGVHWLLGQSGAETSFWSRLARLVMGTGDRQTEHVGWPWFPGAAAWVIPTSLAICALAQQRHGRYGNEIEPRLHEARAFLLSRRCPDQGWNHGGLMRPGELPESYPETTGLALLALAGVPDLEDSLARAERHYREPRSSEGASWLRMGLMVHGRNPAPPAPRYPDWTMNHLALGIIRQAAEAGRNPFIDHV